MKIIQVITLSEPIGGAQMVLYNNTKALVTKGHKVTVIVGQKGSLADKLQAIKVPVIHLPSLQREINPVTDYKCYKEMGALLQQEAPDIVISHSSKAGILCRLACHTKKIRNIFTIHGWSFTPGVKSSRRNLYLALEKLMGKFSDRMIAVSGFDKQLAIKHNICNPERIKVIYNGSPDYLETPKSKKQNIEAIKLLMTARFSFQKDHKTLFKAIQQLRDLNFKVDLVGNGDLFEETKMLAKEMDIDHLVTFHGERNDIPKFLNEADAFVLTSRFEGLPLSICEAMSAGLPVIASNVGGISEMVKDDYNGYLIPKENETVLAQKLASIIKDKEKRQQLGKNARATYLSTFSIDQMATTTEQYLQQILNEK